MVLHVHVSRQYCLILNTYLLNNVLKLQGEVTYQSFVSVKELKDLKGFYNLIPITCSV